MRRMWQKHTPGKRVLALLLAVLMLCDTFTVSAATTEGEVSTEVESEVVEVTEEVTEPEENLVEEEEPGDEPEEPTDEEPVVTDEPTVEDPEVDEPVVDELVEEENGEETTEPEEIVLEGEVEQLTTGSFTLADITSVTLSGYELDEGATVRIRGEASEYVYVWFAAGTLIEDGTVSATLSDAEGRTVNGTYSGSSSWTENDVWYYDIGYEFDLTAYTDFEPTTLTITNTTDAADKKTYGVKYDVLYKTDALGNKTVVGYDAYEVGDVYKLSTKCVEDGVFGYVTVVSTDAAVSIAAGNMPETAKAEWNANYKDDYGAYGANGKYYFFTYGEEVWGPTMTVNGTTGAYLYYYYRIGEGVDEFKELQSTTIYATDYHLEYNGERVYTRDVARINYVDYCAGDIILNICNGSNAYYGNASITSWGNNLTDAISIEENEDGSKYVRIAAELVKNYEGEIIGLEASGTNTLSFGIYLEDYGLYQDYLLCNDVMIFQESMQSWEDRSYVKNGDTIELNLSECMRVELPEYLMVGYNNITDVTITSSDASKLAVHGEPGVEVYENDSFSVESCWLEAKKTGTVKLTANFKYNGTEYTKTINVKVVAGDTKPNFGYYNDNNEFVPFVNGETIDIEQGDMLRLYTTISPRALSSISVKSSNTSLAYTYGTISESFYYDEEYNYAYYNKNNIYCSIGTYSTGQVTLTMSAKYAGKTYTQKVTLNVIEPKGLQIRNVYSGNGSYFNTQNGRVTDIYLSDQGMVQLFTLFDDDADGVTGQANAEDYTLEVYGRDRYDSSAEYEVSSDFEIVFVSDNVFYIVPASDEMLGYYVYDSYKLRVTPKEQSSEEEVYLELTLELGTANQIYLSYNDETKEVSNPVSELYFVEGEDTVFYAKINENNGEVFDFAYGNGLAMKSADIVYRDIENSQVVVKFVASNDGSNKNDYRMSASIRSTDKNYYIVNFNYRLLEATECTAPVATQRQISDFLNAEDTSCDISGVRIQDYVVALNTDETGAKSAVLMGYVGSETEVSMPELFEVFTILELKASGEHSLSYYASIPVIGVEDGVFDTAKGYTQPSTVYLYAGYTYLGTNYTGWVNPDSGKRTAYGWWNNTGNADNIAFSIINEMVFTTVNDQYICVDTGNVNFAAVVPEGVVLYKNRTSGRTVIDLVKANSVSYYNLAKNYLYTVDEEGNETELPILVTVENGQYYLSIDNTHENAEMLAELESGMYYMSLVPTIYVYGKEVTLAEQDCKVVISFENVAPVVKIENSNITVNTYLGDTALTKLDISNSFGTAVTGINLTTDGAIAANKAGVQFVQNGDGDWLLYWNGTSAIPKNTKIEVGFEVEGFTADGTVRIANQTITVNGKSTQPKTSLSAATLTFNDYPYSSQTIEMTIKDGNITNRINPEYTVVEATSVPKGGSEYDVTLTLTEDRRVTVDVHNNAVSGTYKFKITPALAAVRGGDYVPYYASAVTLTVNVKGTKPTIKFAQTANVTLNSNYYNVTETLPGLIYATVASEQVSAGIMHNPDNGVDVTAIVKSMPKNADETLVKLIPYFAGVEATTAEQKVYDLSEITFVASVASGALAGSYTYTINVPAIVNGDVVWMTTIATVTVVNTLPSFKFSESTITLDAAYPYDELSENINYSSAEIRLVMDEGYRLAGASYTWGTNYNAYECVDITYNAEAGNGAIYFDVSRAGLTKGGTVTLTPKVIAPSGEEITLKPMKVTLKVTNSSNATLNSKVKAITVNPYLNTTTANAQLTTKGFTEVSGLGYTYSYDFIPVDYNAYLAEEYGYALTVSADGSEIYASNWEGVPDGKYTYNLVQKITASDGTVAYTKPVTFTVTVKAKALTVVPEKSSVTLYKNWCHVTEIDGVAQTYTAYISLNIKELPGEELYNYVSVNADNNMAAKGVVTKIGYTAEEETTLLAIQFPATMSSLKNLKVTPVALDGVYAEFGTFTINITMKNGNPTATFANSALTLDRYTTTQVINNVSHSEGFDVYGMELVSITKKGSNTDVSDMFDVVIDEEYPNYISVAINEDYRDTIGNGTYIVKVSPLLGCVVSDGTTSDAYGNYVGTCSFNLNITQPKLSLSVSEKAVNLYPDLGEVTSSPISVKVLDGTTELPISKVEVVGPTSKVVSTGTVNADNTITFSAFVNDEGKYTSGSNTYNLKVYVKNYNGTADILAGTISKAVTVKVKTLPTKVTLTNTKLTFSPYLEQNVITSVKDAELAALMTSGNYEYVIGVVEKDSKYKKDVEANNVIDVNANPNGDIVITRYEENFPEKNVTYYYTANINLLKSGETVAQYSVNFSVAVKNTKPVAALQQANVTLNNAYLEQVAYNRVSLSTGNSMWTLAEQDTWDIVVKDSKGKDITDKAILKAFMYDASEEGTTAVYTNDVVVSLYTADERGIIDVPKGSYKISLTPKVTDSINTIELAPVTMTVKVISNRPTVKYSGTKVTVNTYNNLEQSLKLTMSNGGDFATYIAECTKYPKGVTTDDGITLNLAADGTLTVKADRTAKAGTYTYKFTPVTVIDGYGIALDSQNITVVVTNTMPTAVLSSNKVTVNSLFADDYCACIDVTAKNAGEYKYVFSDDAIEFVDSKSTKQTVRDNAKILLENMDVELFEDGRARVVVMLPTDKTVANGTYKFTLTPSIMSGNEMSTVYELKPVTFSVVVENKKPTLSAKVSGTIDLVNQTKNTATVQLSFNKQNYETIDNIEGIRVYDKSTGEDTWQFRVEYYDWESGKLVLTPSTTYLQAGKSYALQVEATSNTGNVYLVNVTVKTAQANYKITAGTANYYTAINSGNIQLSTTEGVYLNNVEVLKVTTDKGGKKAISGVTFDGRLGSDNTVEIWSDGDLPSNIKKGTTIYVQLEVTPYGLASNKKPTTITVPVTVK